MPAHFTSNTPFGSPHARFATRQFFYRCALAVCILVILTGCNTPSTSTPSQSTTIAGAISEPPIVYNAEVTFEAHLLAPLTGGKNLYVEVLDEVTGLALNTLRIKMEKVGSLKYTLKVPFALGSVVKYRYVRDNDPAAPIEYTSRGQQVRYRLHFVDGPGVALDVISGWKNDSEKSAYGRIHGQVSLTGSNAPVVNALVTAGGVTTMTASDGSFLLEGLPAGTHTIVVYALDGSFQVFQQGAVVAPDSTTPASIQVSPTKQVTITFIANPPANGLKGLPVRLIGNIYSLGNTFADLNGGVSVVASRAPLMTAQPDGRYSLKLQLPVGLDLRYKYSLGDGFWNAEHRTGGDFMVRQIIVPDQDTTYDDQIESWSAGGTEPITFTVTTPKDTPVSDTISIQFNPYGWTEPLPMWPTGDNRWFYILYSPLDRVKTAGYRYCRNEQCGAALASDAANKTFNANDPQKSIDDSITSWAWWQSPSQSVTVPANEVKPRGDLFLAGVEFVPAYRPGWQPYLIWGLENIKEMGGNSVILSPTWHWTNINPPVVEPVPGQDALWNDLTAQANLAHQRGLNIIYHAVTITSGQTGAWWQEAARDENFWQSWFDRYHTFLIYHADLATQTGAKVLVIGDDTVLPALPGGKLADGSSSNVPEDAASRWQAIIADVRMHYKGRLAWMISMDGQNNDLPEILKNVDQAYVVVSAPLTTASPVDQTSLDASFAKLLDERVKPIQEKTNQPVLLGLLYPSAAGAAAGCVPSGGKCLPKSALMAVGAPAKDVQIDFDVQAQIYNAALSAINERGWVEGIFSSGYYPPVALKDASTSVRNKPAADVLWYWFPRLIGKGP